MGAEVLHRRAAESIAQADGLLFGRVTYEMMEAAWPLAGHGPTLFMGVSNPIDLKLVSRLEFSSGAVALQYEPRR